MKPIRKVLVVTKRPAFLDRPKRFRRRGHPLTRHSRLALTEHQKTLAAIRNVLKHARVSSTFQNRVNLGAIRKFDLILTVGGDGTLLKTSHRISNQPVLGINSSPSTSVGALCSLRGDHVGEQLPSILAGRYHLRPLNRLEIRVNGHRVPFLALNDLLFCNKSPGATSRYLIRIGRREEEQRSSGVWISTAAGSTAAIYAAGGRKLNLSSRKFQYLVREPFRPVSIRGYRLRKGVLSGENSLHLVSKMAHASLFIDGLHGFVPLSFGDSVDIALGGPRLNLAEPI